MAEGIGSMVGGMASALGGIVGGHQKETIILRISYLFLSVDNKISDADLTLFDEVGKSIDKFSEMREKIIDDCENLLSKASESSNRFSIINKEISSCITYIRSESNGNRDILWALINLFFRTQNRSKKHTQLIKTWAEENQIDASIVLEMFDIYETQIKIIEYREWLETSNNLSPKEIITISQQLDVNQKSIEQSISDLIALG